MPRQLGSCASHGAETVGQKSQMSCGLRRRGAALSPPEPRSVTQLPPHCFTLCSHSPFSLCRRLRLLCFSSFECWPCLRCSPSRPLSLLHTPPGRFRPRPRLCCHFHKEGPQSCLGSCGPCPFPLSPLSPGEPLINARSRAFPTQASPPDTLHTELVPGPWIHLQSPSLILSSPFLLSYSEASIVSFPDYYISFFLFIFNFLFV